jgi:hypothetical protein
LTEIPSLYFRRPDANPRFMLPFFGRLKGSNE